MKSKLGACVAVACLCFPVIAQADRWSDSPSWSFRPTIGLEAPNVVGIQGGATWVAGKASGNGGVGTSMALYSTLGPVDLRVTQTASLAGGSQGAEGLWVPEIALGHRFEATEAHGFVVRLGARGSMQGNDRFWITTLTAPELQLAYQFRKDEALFELGVRGGVALAGRYEVDGFTRSVHFPSASFGAYSALGIGPLWLEGSFSRIDSNDVLSTPLDRADASLCFRHGLLAICAGARTSFARLPVPTATNVADTKSAAVTSAFALVGFAL